MFPIKSNISLERFPIVTVALIAIGLLVYLLWTSHSGLPSFLLDIVFLGLLGAGVESTLGRPRFCALCLLGGLLALATWTLADAGSSSPLLFGASGVTAVVLGVHLLLHPRARVLTLVTVPFFAGIVEIPATLLIGMWLVLQVGFGAAGLG